MNTEIKNTVHASEQRSQYDESAKQLLGQKIILAHILAATVDEFKGMEPKNIVPFIEGEPLIGIVPVEPGLTNAGAAQKGQKVAGFNTENSEINEGLVRFDIVFYVRMKDGISQIILNVEAQKDKPAGYDILNRAVFYVSRLISSQKGRDFENTNYNDIKRVYSIWLVMSMEENILTHIRLAPKDILGSYDWPGKMDLFNIVMIGLAKDLPEHEEKTDLHRLLGALLSATLAAEKKLDIINTEYDIPIENKLREEVDSMCNLSQGIWETAEAAGRAAGEAAGRAAGEAVGRAAGEAAKEADMILAMRKADYSYEEITKIFGMTKEQIQQIEEDSMANV